MKDRMKYHSIFLLLLCHIAISEANSQLKDFFPLIVGAERHYSFSLESHYEEYFPPGKEDYVRDSGTVAYKFLSFSFIDDTTIVWSVRESLNVKSVEYHRSYLGVTDTSRYETNIGINFQLYEYTTGSHLLTAHSNILRLHSNTYRYSDQQSDTLMQAIANDFTATIYNTFVNNIGLVKMFSDTWFQGHSTRGFNKKEVTLLHYTVVSVSDDPQTTFFLSQNYPNPFNPATSIEYALPFTTRVTLEIVSSLGQTVFILHRGEQAAGKYTFVWNANSLPTGVYYLRFLTDNGIQSRKLLLLK